MGILDKFYTDSVNNPNRELYDFMGYSNEDFQHNIVTTKDAWDKARDIAYELKAKGAKKGDRAIIICMQDAGTVYAIWGCMIVGVVFTVIPPPIDTGKVSRFISVLRSCSPKFLISNEYMEKTQGGGAKGDILKGAFKEILSLKRIYTDKVTPHPEFTEVHSYADEDIVYLQYTSGSTSEPKGVMVSHGNILACLDQCKEIFDFTKGDHNLCSWVPFYHNIGLIVAIFLPMIVSHGISYFIPTLEFLAKPTIWIKALSDYKINATAAPNSAYEIITQIVSKEAAKQYNLKHVTHLINGSEFVDANTVKKFSELFEISENAFAPGYGLSECVCVASLSCNDFRVVNIDSDEYRQGRFVPVDREDKTIVGVGRIAGDMVLKIVDKDGVECAAGEIGEIYLKGSSICQGYYKNPEETKRFHAKIKGEEGDYFRTGDMGYMYEENVYLTGRIKEMIVVSGKNLFPYDIIRVIANLNIGLFNDSMAVFSVLHEGIEAPVLCVETQEALSENEVNDLFNQINRAVSDMFEFSFRDIVIVKKGFLPRTDNRKIKTLQTKRLYEEGNLSKLYSMLGKTLSQEESVPIKISKAFSREFSVNEIKDFLREIISQIVPNTDFGDEDSFLELGADSLTMARLVTILEEETKVSVDLRKLIDNPCIDMTAKYIFGKINGEQSILDDGTVDLYKEVALPDSLKLERNYDIKINECKNIFLTGSTGFLGAYIIEALIKEHGNKGIKIYAHARAASKEKAMERIAENMKRFNCYKNEYMKYIIPVIGDITLPKLGIGENEFEDLTRSIDLIIHNGAILNFLLSYTKLKDANVVGTLHALELAMSGKPKYFSYISSYSVYDNPSHFKKIVSEDDELSNADGYFLGYSETKWVSEKLIQESAKRGLKTIVYRPGDITGTMKDGIWKLEDLISRSIVGCIQLNAVPDMDVHLHLTPVDYVASVISHTTFLDEAVGKGINIINKFTRPMSQIRIMMKKYGYNPELLSYEAWCDKLQKSNPNENVLRVLSCLFTDKKPIGENLNERYGSYQAQFSSENCDKFMSDTNVTCPPINEALLLAYLNNFYAAGYIKKPAKWYQRLFS